MSVPVHVLRTDADPVKLSSREKAERRRQRRAFYLEAQGGRCYLCDAEMHLGDPNDGAFATWDHLKPLSEIRRTKRPRGGPENVLLACRRCNMAKAHWSVLGIEHFRARAQELWDSYTEWFAANAPSRQAGL